jgi:ketosteroid isomerase-like protein
MEKVTAGFHRKRRHGTKRSQSRLHGSVILSDNVSNDQTLNDQTLNDHAQILALHEAGDKALMNADLDMLAQIFADDYVQYNESGKAFTKQDVLNSFRTGAIRYPSIVSTERTIRVFGGTAVVHGSESDEVEADGKRFPVRYVYLDVLRKEKGEWKLVASQLAKPTSE